MIIFTDNYSKFWSHSCQRNKVTTIHISMSEYFGHKTNPAKNVVYLLILPRDGIMAGATYNLA
jgi:hypothetical protein